MAEVIEQGFEQATMARIAQRAGASKETLYAWFSDKNGLVTAIIEENADRAIEALQLHLTNDPDRAEAMQALTGCARGLLTLLTSPDSIALNRAAMSVPSLAEKLRTSGSGRARPVIEGYLERLHRLGIINAPDAREAFGVFYGLTIQDTQIRVLLRESPPSSRQITAQADRAVERFIEVCS